MNVNNNINFKGYSNVFCTLDVPLDDGKRVSLLSMRLNDEDGYKDLSELRTIYQMQGIPLGNENEDVITISYIDDDVKKSENIYFNGKSMYWGDELLEIEEKYIPKMMSHKQYQLEKDIHMKIYTLIANLTSRLEYAKFNSEDNGISHVIENIYVNMCAVLKDPTKAFHLTNIACSKQHDFKQVATAFNRGVDRTMKKFFKVV